jgi:hypothetical protein
MHTLGCIQSERDVSCRVCDTDLAKEEERQTTDRIGVFRVTGSFAQTDVAHYITQRARMSVRIGSGWKRRHVTFVGSHIEAMRFADSGDFGANAVQIFGRATAQHTIAAHQLNACSVAARHSTQEVTYGVSKHIKR